MPNVKANGIEIEYETFGKRGASPILLIMGLSAQMIGWEKEFCEQLAGKGLFVIRFDNRDVGLSTKFDGAGIPDIMAVTRDRESNVPYSLDDMADDAVGLLDGLGLEKAHICGASMGAMITQIIGYRHSARCLSLIPIMGSTGRKGLPPSKSEAMEILITPAPEQREAYIEYSVVMWRFFWGSLDFDEEIVRRRAAASYDRAFYPPGIVRQQAAILASGDRRPGLGSITAPTLVIHGSEDPLFPLEHGKDTADAIPGAELLIIEGMGHCLPKAAWPEIIDAIANHTRKASE